jgi:hypothetical protein
MDASVLRIPLAANVAARFEGLDDTRHRRRPHLLGGCELAERPGAAEDQHGQRRELRGRHAGRGILPANVPEGMDGRRVEAVGCVD